LTHLDTMDGLGQNIDPVSQPGTAWIGLAAIAIPRTDIQVNEKNKSTIVLLDRYNTIYILQILKSLLDCVFNQKVI